MKVRRAFFDVLTTPLGENSAGIQWMIDIQFSERDWGRIQVFAAMPIRCSNIDQEYSNVGVSCIVHSDEVRDFLFLIFNSASKAGNHLALSGFVKGYSIYPTVSNFQDELRSGQRFQFFLCIIYKDNSGRNTHLKLKWPNVGYFLLFFFFFLWRRQQTEISH